MHLSMSGPKPLLDGKYCISDTRPKAEKKRDQELKRLEYLVNMVQCKMILNYLGHKEQN